MKILKYCYIAYGALAILFLMVEFFRFVMSGKDPSATLMAVIFIWGAFVILPVFAMKLLVRVLWK